MTYMVNDLAEYLEDQSLGTVGTDIFCEHMPDTSTVAICTVLYAYPGNPPEKIGGVEWPGLQVKTRGSLRSRYSALDRMYDVMNALHSLGETTIEGVRYLWIEAQGSPAFAGYDKKEYPVYVLNFIVCKDTE